MTTVLTPSDVAQLMRSVAMLAPGSPSGLDKETAYDVLSQLEELQLCRLPRLLRCPHCREALGVTHRRRPAADRPSQQPRHPDPVGAAGSAEGAEAATQALGQALLWRGGPPGDQDDYWVGIACAVLRPLLVVARSTGGDVDAVADLAHPDHSAATLVSVAGALDELGSDEHAGRARRDWAATAGLDTRAQRMAFTYAFRMALHWQTVAASPAGRDDRAAGLG